MNEKIEIIVWKAIELIHEVTLKNDIDKILEQLDNWSSVHDNKWNSEYKH